MTKLHTKGYVLQQLNRAQSGLWDYEIAQKLLCEYNKQGEYEKGNVRLMLADLYASGLVLKTGSSHDDKAYFGHGKTTFKYVLSDFGKARVVETELA